MTSINVKKYLCNTCNNIYDLYDMIVPPRQKPTQCRTCLEIVRKKWRNKNKEKIKFYQLKYNYGITEKQYNELFKKQKGICAICHEANQQDLGLDHNHKTKKIRELLCFKCNSLLGLLNEDLSRLEKIRDYLLKHLDFEGEYIPEIKEEKINNV